MITVIGMESAYLEEPDFWSRMDHHMAHGRVLRDSRGLRSQRGRATKAIEDSESAMKATWSYRKDCRYNDYCGMLERRFNRSAKTKQFDPLVRSVTRRSEVRESDEDLYWAVREYS